MSIFNSLRNDFAKDFGTLNDKLDAMWIAMEQDCLAPCANEIV